VLDARLLDEIPKLHAVVDHFSIVIQSPQHVRLIVLCKSEIHGMQRQARHNMETIQVHHSIKKERAVNWKGNFVLDRFRRLCLLTYMMKESFLVPQATYSIFVNRKRNAIWNLWHPIVTPRSCTWIPDRREINRNGWECLVFCQSDTSLATAGSLRSNILRRSAFDTRFPHHVIIKRWPGANY